MINRPGAGGGGEPPPWLAGGGNRPGGGDNRPGGGGGGEMWPGGGTRPPTWGGNRPGGGGSGEPPPWLGGGGNRPWRPDRPGGGGSGERWPPWRPGDNNRPDRPNWWANRPNRPIINRPDNSTNITSNRFNQFNNQQFNVNNAYVSGYGGNGGWGGYGGYGFGGFGYPGYGGSGFAASPYTDWYQGASTGWFAPLAAWSAAAATTAASSWLADASAFAYSNPYFIAPQTTTVVQPVYSYSEPIPADTSQPDATYINVDNTAVAPPPPAPADAAPTVTAAPPPPPPAEPDPKVKAAMETFASARDAFKGGDYVRAEQLVEAAINQTPADPVMHEFRALTLFAQGKYPDAAATLYAVLARGPGWDWDTMRSLYPDADTYTRQLRALEGFIGAHPSDGAARFVLAYHYLVTRQTDAAVRQLHEVVKLTPQNTLAADMIRALTPPPTTNDAPKAGT